MKLPKFELRKILADGSQESPEVFPVEKLPFENVTTDRRGFLGAGLTAAALLASGRVRGRDAAEPIRTMLLAHDSQIESLHFSEDGKSLVSVASEDAKIWSMPGGKLRRRIKDSLIRNAVPLPGNKFFTTTKFDQIEIRSLQTGDLVRTLKDADADFVASLPDGKTLASSSKTGHRIQFWDFNTGVKKSEIADCFGEWTLRKWALSRDGAHFYSFESLGEHGGSRKLNVRKTSDGTLLKTLREIVNDSCDLLLVSKDGARLFATIGVESAQLAQLHVWNLKEDIKELNYEDVNNSGILAISPNGDKVFTQDRESGKYEIAIWQAPLISPNQRQVLDLFSLDSFESLKEPRKKLSAHDAEITALCASPDGRLLASGDSRGTIKIWNCLNEAFLAYLYDPKINEEDGISYNVYDKTTGTNLTYTLPCGSPIPPGAVCTCNCVSGTKPIPRPEPTYYESGTYCSCNKICTCIPVCQAHRLLHPDPAVRLLAEEILLLLGKKERAYLEWACSEATDARLKKRIRQFIRRTEAGEAPNPARWLPASLLENYLANEDEVVQVMAAQMLGQGWSLGHYTAKTSLFEKVKITLEMAEQLHWKRRANQDTR